MNDTATKFDVMKIVEQLLMHPVGVFVVSVMVSLFILGKYADVEEDTETGRVHVVDVDADKTAFDAQMHRLDDMQRQLQNQDMLIRMLEIERRLDDIRAQQEHKVQT